MVLVTGKHSERGDYGVNSEASTKKKGDPEVGARIRQIRLEKGLTLKLLAWKANFDQPNLSKLETGQIGFSPESIRRIADALGVQVAELFSSASLGELYWVPLKEDGEKKRMLPTFYPVSPRAFAFKIKDESLHPIIARGDIVICEPDVHLYRRGVFVAAKLVGKHDGPDIIVRRMKNVIVEWKHEDPDIDYFEGDPVHELVSENSFYPSIKIPRTQVLGIIVQRISNMLEIQV